MVKIGNLSISEFPIILAPMEDVSDPPFRKLCKQHGADLMFTEFISSEGLIRNAAKSIQKMDILKGESPIGIQIFGNNIDAMVEATKIISQTQTDIIDINYGCPVKKVAYKGAGAGILKDIPKMVKMTKEVIKNTSLPVTVKTRLGWDEKSMLIEDVVLRLQDVGVKAISIHGRTRKQMYKGHADWTLIGKVKSNPKITIPIFGNGDVNSPEIALEKKEKYLVDGIMIGRAAIGYPWIFNQIKWYLKNKKKLPPPTYKQRLEVVKQHFEDAVIWKGETLGILEMRKHYANYFRGIDNFKPFRLKLVTSNNIDEVRAVMQEIEYHFASNPL